MGVRRIEMSPSNEWIAEARSIRRMLFAQGKDETEIARTLADMAAMSDLTGSNERAAALRRVATSCETGQSGHRDTDVAKG